MLASSWLELTNEINAGSSLCNVLNMPHRDFLTTSAHVLIFQNKQSNYSLQQ